MKLLKIGFGILVALNFHSCKKEVVFLPWDDIVEIREVDFFDQIHNEGIANINIYKSNEITVEVRGDSVLLSELITTVADSKLRISVTNPNLEPNTFAIDIGLPSIYLIENDGTGLVYLRNYRATELNIIASGSGDLILFNGSAETLNLHKSGSGMLNGFKFDCEEIKINQSGTGEVQVKAENSIRGSLSGAGDLKFRGTPEINVDVTGTGDVIDAN